MIWFGFECFLILGFLYCSFSFFFILGCPVLQWGWGILFVVLVVGGWVFCWGGFCGIMVSDGEVSKWS